MRRLLMIIALCAFSVIPPGGLAQAEGPTLGVCPPAGTSEDLAAAIGLPVSCRATFGATPIDWYAVTLARGQRFVLAVTPQVPQFATTLTLKDPDSIPMASKCGAPQSLDTNTADTCDLVVAKTGTWKIGVGSAAGAGSYQLSLLATTAQADCGTPALGGDAPEAGVPLWTGGPNDAIPLPLPATEVPGKRTLVCTGSFSSSEISDVYAFSVAAGESISIREGPEQIAGVNEPLGTTNRVIGLVLVPPTGDPDDNVPGTPGIDVVAKWAGTYQLRVAANSPYSADGGQYVLSIAVQQNDCGLAANEVPSQSTFDLASIASGTLVSCQGMIDLRPANPGDATPPDPMDRYSFPSTAGVPVALGIDSSPGQCHTLRIFAPGANAGSSVPRSTCDGAAPAAFSDPNGSGGTWTVEVGNGNPIISLDSYTLVFGDNARGVASNAGEVIVLSHADRTMIREIGVRGLDPDDYLVTSDGTCRVGIVLAVGATCSIDTVFRATEFGPRSASLAVTAEIESTPASRTTRLASLNGTGTSAIIQAGPPSLNFPPTRFGTHSASRSVTVTNVDESGNSLSIGNVFTTGHDASDFGVAVDKNGTKLDACTKAVLSQGESCIVQIDFAPQANGTRTAELVIPNGSANPARLELAGTGLAPAPAVSPSSLVFPDTALGQSSTRSIQITNEGGDALTGLSPSFTGEFDLASGGTCSGTAIVAPGSWCTYAVRFAPLATGRPGARAGSMKIASNATTVPFPVVALSGNATNSGPAPALTPVDEVDFDPQVVNTWSPPKPVTLLNAGSAGLSLTGTVLTPNATEFAADASACPSSLGAGKSCTINVSFRPTRAAARGTQLVVNFGNASPASMSLTLVGLGVPGGGQLIAVHPALPDQLIDTTGPRQVLALKNTGTAPVRGIAIESSSKEFVSYGTGCPASLAPGASCSLGVSFRPAAIGKRCGDVTITSDQPAGPISKTLCGNGLAPLVALIAPTFPNVVLGRASTPRDLVITNSGTYPLVVSSVDLENAEPSNADFLVTSDSCTDVNRPNGQAAVAVSSFCVIRFVFTPKLPGTRETATVRIATDAAGPSIAVPLAGVGLIPQPDLNEHGGGYRLTANGIAYASPPQPEQNDCDLEVPDASNDVRAPSSLGESGTTFSCEGQIRGPADLGDYYELPAVAATDIVHLTFEQPPPVGVIVCQYDASGSPVEASYAEDGTLIGCASDHRVSGDDLDGGTHWIVGVTGPAGASYDFTVVVVHQNDCGLGQDAADSIDEALVGRALDASMPVSCEGALRDSRDEVDIYKVILGTSAGALGVAVAPASIPSDPGTGADFDVVVRAPDGSVTNGANGGAGQAEVVAGVCGAPARACGEGAWLVEVRYVRGAHDGYRLVLVGR